MDPNSFLIMGGGLVAGILLFIGLLLLGLRIIRLLGLTPTEADLPEILRYEPEPPAIRETLDPVAARTTAAIQAMRWQACRLAWQAVEEYRHLHQAVAKKEKHPRVAEALVQVKEAEAGAAAAEGAMRILPPELALTKVTAELERVRAARAAGEACFHG